MKPPHEHVLITGGASRLGLSLAHHLASEGTQVSIQYHRTEPSPLYPAIRADLGNVREASGLIGEVTRRFGSPSSVVLSASRLFSSPIEGGDSKVQSRKCTDNLDIDFANNMNSLWNDAFQINTGSALQIAQAFVSEDQVHPAPQLLFIIDSFAERGFSNHSVYASTKTALIGLMKQLARQWAPRLRVNAISPGVILFPNHYDDSKRRAIISHVPLGEGQPSDFCEAVSFLLRCTYTTGFCLRVDGGRNLSPSFGAQSIR